MCGCDCSIGNKKYLWAKGGVANWAKGLFRAVNTNGGKPLPTVRPLPQGEANGREWWKIAGRFAGARKAGVPDLGNSSAPKTKTKLRTSDSFADFPTLYIGYPSISSYLWILAYHHITVPHVQVVPIPNNRNVPLAPAPHRSTRSPPEHPLPPEHRG